MRYVTTAIVYPNSRIHIGWAWETITADWLVRGWKSFGHPTRFVTGADEHASKVAKAAEKLGLSPQEYCDNMASDIEKVLKLCGLQYDRFIRTSDADHKAQVTRLITQVYESGDIYLGKYEGDYCDGCEAYYTEKDLVNGMCPTHKASTKKIKEENYFFRLSKFQDKLLKLYEENPNWIQPESRRSEIVNFVKQGLQDFSVSREGQNWGIPLPFAKTHVVYVWFDALLNYLTAAKSDDGDVWPATVHIVGKDVARFHCVYWPAMLMSLGLPLPKRVFAHGWLSFRGERLSKSSGNSVTPDDVIRVAGSDPLRFFLLGDNHFSGDGSFGWESLIAKNNSDLANEWGNLVNRSISMTRKYFPDQEVRVPVTDSLRDYFAAFVTDLERALDAIDSFEYIQVCQKKVRELNLYIDRMKPWAMAKSAENQKALEGVMHNLLEGIRFIATGLTPVLPFGMPKVFAQLGIPNPDDLGALKNLSWGDRNYKPNLPEPIYPRIDPV